MNDYGLNDLRKSFLDFFESKGHIIAPGFSLVPKDDPSLLLINSGMAPLKPYFTGAKEPPGLRMATCQKCIRTPDIENVGKTARHGTFFEMLGNFSFGDYFKKEAIMWSWEYFTEVLKFDRSFLYVSVYEEDQEAYDIWKNIEGFDHDRIVKLGKKDNFWEHGTGPCGPCSELYYDRGEMYGCGSSCCSPGCDCDRFIEVWNLVFTQFDKDEEGNYHLLPKPNIDTGMGLERLAVVCQGARNMFEVDTIKGIIDRICELTGKIYGADEKDDISIRVITDHIRGITHMISDGIMPSNEGRGYVLRRLLRRAARHGRLLGSGHSFLKILSGKAIEVSSFAYPELLSKQEHIYRIVANEADKFDRTLDAGLEVLKEMITNTRGDTISGADTFKLHDTFGFPIDLTREIAWENKRKVDERGFLELMAKQKGKAREAFKSKSLAWAKDDGRSSILQGLENEFLGYDILEIDSVPLKLFSDQKEVSEAEAGDVINAVFDKTPFYAQSGGQAADTGWIRGDGFRASVIDVKKYEGLHIHVIEIEEGSISTGRSYQLIVDKETREATMRNHTATHILHKALCDEIGAHVEQKGSYVDALRLRFDFSHFQPIDKKILEKIEKKANSIIFSALQVKTEVMKLQQAKEKGAKALFDEKYSEDVRVISVGDYSSELCGGTHVSNSGQIGSMRILSETGIAAGVRRIEALTGFNALDHLTGKERQLEELASIMKSPVEDAKTKLISILDTGRELSKQLDELKQEIATRELGSKDNKPMEINGLYIFSKLFTDMDAKTMRETADAIKERYPDSVILIGSVFQDKVSFIVSCSDKAVSKGLNAGEIIREVAQTAGGGGGGRATLAQAGGKDPLMADAAVKRGIEVIKEILA